MTERPRICVVTGGALGIGGAISRRFARAGDHVVLNDIDEDAAEATRREIESAGGSCVVVVGDITAEDVVSETAEAALDAAGGRVDVLVNNVGDFRPTSWTFARSTPQQWRRLYELNLHHVFTMTHALLPAMIERGAGVIVNNSTVEAFRGIPGKAVYSAFNAGVSAFTKSLAVEVGQHGVRVNAIAPDLSDTPQTPADAMLRGRDQELIGTWVPVGHFGAAEDSAAAVEFLASAEARYITGHTLPVDGGTLAASGWYARADGKGWTNMPNRP